jgi:hypothetical protein
MSVNEYVTKFTQLSRYALHEVNTDEKKQECFLNGLNDGLVSYSVFMPNPCTHRMHDLGSIVPHIWLKVITDNLMSPIKYNYYINNVCMDYDDSQLNGIAKDSITPQGRQPRQHVAYNSKSKNSSPSSPSEQ